MINAIEQNKIKLIRILLLISFILAFAVCSISAQTKMWVNGYYAGWMQGQNNDGYLTAQNIDFSAMTQIIHFSLVPNADGTVDAASNSITTTNSSALISAAHAAGVKVIICVGGWNSESNFLSATSSANLSTFVNNLVSFIQTRGYDGIDIDWETLSSSDAAQYSTFITTLRTALNKISPRPLFTAATAWQPSIFASLYSQFDQINLMTYDLSGAWQGWVTWHNSPIYDGGVKFPSTGGAVPSINGMVSTFTSAGVPASKLGIGMDFYGYIWNGGSGTPTGGVTAPDQSWSTAPTVQGNVPYYQIMDQYYQPSRDKWDSGAQAAYLSIEDNTNSANDQFISYDNATTAQSKVNYVKSNGLGGMIIWELGAGYRSNMPAGQQQPLLEAIKAAVNGGTIVSNADTTGPTISITSPANGSTITGAVNITANASDNVGVASVVFSIDGSQTVSLLTASPFSISLNTILLSNSAHNISATAKDAAGNSAASTINITVSNIVDIAPPVVSISSPTNGTTVSNIINITASASDNVGVASVAINVDGSQVGSTLTASPYSVSWNTSLVANGSHTITAVAKDAAGNTASSSAVTVTVSNNVVVNNSSDLPIYQDNLNNWIDASWGETENYSSTQPVYAGTNSIKVVQGAWGALRLLSGSWGTPVLINPANYKSLQFAVYGESTGLNFSIYFENNSKGYFPAISYGSIPANQWTVITIPISIIDPNNLLIRDLVIQEVSGKKLTYDLDNVILTGNGSVTASTNAPNLLLPANSQTGLSTSPVLSWTKAASAVSYHVKVSTDQTFASSFLDKTGVADTTLAVTGLNNGTVYYWKVSAVNSAGTETSSQVWNFTTGSSTSVATSTLPVYNDALLTPWINTSWSSTVNFSSTEQAYQSSSNSVKVVQNAWGAFSLHDGNWGSNTSVDIQSYNAVQFAVFSSTNIALNVLLENDGGSSFPTIDYGSVAANTWTIITIPLSQLNPNNNVIERLDILETSGVQKTYYVDNISFIYSASAKAVANVSEKTNIEPTSFTLSQNYPNPFNPSTNIDFSLPSSTHITLNIYNVLGEKVTTLVDDNLSEGEHSVSFHADNLASGIYIYQLRAGNTVLQKKMNLLK